MEESKLVKGRKLPTSKEVAEYGYKAMMRGRPVAIPGVMNKLLTMAPRFTPVVGLWLWRMFRKRKS
jgi:short-subunit dehydrogenase